MCPCEEAPAALLARSASLLALACERCVSERSAVEPLACVRCVSARSDAAVDPLACEPLDCAAALAGGVAVVDWLVDALSAVPDEALGLVVDPLLPAVVSPLRLPLVFGDAVPDEALCECVLDSEAARALSGAVPLD